MLVTSYIDENSSKKESRFGKTKSGGVDLSFNTPVLNHGNAKLWALKYYIILKLTSRTSTDYYKRER